MADDELRREEQQRHDEQLRQIHAVLDAYKAAVWAKEVAAFAAIYASDVRVFDLWGEWSYDGIDAWRSMAEGWFASLGTECVVVDFDDVRTVLDEHIAVVHAFVNYRATDADGAPLHAMHNRLTWTLKRHAGAWRVVHEHTSAPVAFHTSKAILLRA